MNISELPDSVEADLSNIDLDVIDDSRQSMLQKAIASRKFQLARAILRAKVNLDHQDREGYTAFVYAVTHGDPDLALLIAEQGVNVELADRNGNTSLWHAVMHVPQDKSIVNKLIKLGANLDHRNKFGSSIRDLCERMGVVLD